MDKFQNKTTLGQEKAIRRGVRVPDGDVNLAWVKGPALNPDNNIVIIDTSGVTPENADGNLTKCQLMYADELGILQDDSGNQVIFEEYPAVADVFSVDEDFSNIPGNEYTADSILPFVHVSRYFHVDTNGLSTADMITHITIPNVRVVNADGKDYVTKDNKPRYRIGLARAVDSSPGSAQVAYRIHAYVDTDDNENLYLTYNKIELTTNGKFKNQNINHRELLNPKTYFSYRPEETEVFDPANRTKKIYSTKPTNQKEQILGTKSSNVDGFKVHVPKKAVFDPRVFQLFRWRVSCDFVESIQIDPSRSAQSVRCGVVCTNHADTSYVSAPRSFAPYPFYNLSLSDYNAAKLPFTNPLSEKITRVDTTLARADKTKGAYWSVNFDTISNRDLENFDILVWYPETVDFDFTPYLAKIDYFTRQLGGTLIIEAGCRANPKGLGCVFTSPVDPRSGNITYPDATTGYTFMNTLAPVNKKDVFFDGRNKLGGWDFNDGSNDEYITLHPGLIRLMEVWTAGNGKNHYIESFPASYEKILVANTLSNVSKAQMIRQAFDSGGAVIIDTTDVALNSLSNPNTGQLLSSNFGDTAYNAGTSEDYGRITSASAQEGAFKLFYNICLYALKGRALDDSDEFRLATSWTMSSGWHPSWIINNQNDVLSRHEIETNQFTEQVKSRTDPTVVWQRRLEVPAEHGKTTPKTFKQLIDESMSPDDLRKVKNSARSYKIEVTNSNVLRIDTVDINENDIPHVWTDAYTPAFSVPRELGAYIVKERLAAGEYISGQYVSRSYPPKPYGVRAGVKYSDTSQDVTSYLLKWTAHGTAKTTLTISDSKAETWGANGSGQYWISYNKFDFGTPHPLGIDTYGSANYYNQFSNHNYPSYDAWVRLGYGNWGRIVYWLQEAFNYFVDFGYLQGPKLVQDGYWGYATQAAVDQIQDTFIALEPNGMLDAETFSIIGYQILRLQKDYQALYGTLVPDELYPLWQDQPGRNRTFFDSPFYQMGRSGMSDGNSDFTYSKRSNIGNWNNLPGRPIATVPTYIWDILQIQLNHISNIVGVTIIPRVERGDGNFGGSMLYQGLSVLNSATLPVVNYNDFGATLGKIAYDPFNHGVLGNFPANTLSIQTNERLYDAQPHHVDIGPYRGDILLVRLGQDTPQGVGAGLQFGVQDILIHTEFSFSSSKTYTFTKTGYAKVTTGQDVFIHLDPPDYHWDVPNDPWGLPVKGVVSDVNWSSIDMFIEGIVDPGDFIYHSLQSNGDLLFRNLRVLNAQSTNYTDGPFLGRTRTSLPRPGPFETYYHNQSPNPATNTLFYSKDEHGVISPMPETGWISKVDGIKLFCTKSGDPYGFPTMPSLMGAKESQRHYALISLSMVDTDPEVLVGFYDIAKQEFILSNDGKPEMTYFEWISRGPANVFIAAVTDFEVSKKQNLPTEGGSPLPYRIAMPVYGLCTKSGSHIRVEPLPSNLGPMDLWSIPVRTGSFTRSIALSDNLTIPITTSWLRGYAGKQVRAFYSVPEASNHGWSTIFGRPYIDVRSETPKILSDTLIQVLQPPFHQHEVPSAVSMCGTAANPVRPEFEVSVRATYDGSWTKLEWKDIADYNVSTGEIYLVSPLPLSDPTGVKVDYTTARSNYNLRHADGNPINLNPYPQDNRSLIGKPIYVYILPEFVRTEENTLIAGSSRTSTLGWTLDPSLFDVNNPLYNPLAIQLAVVYITTALDINDLSILDTRRRGGGARDTAKLSELTGLVEEASNYWDFNYGTGGTYQRGGFVIVRLPAALRDSHFTSSDIMEIITKNITAGVQFKIEDLEGREW